MAAGFDRHDAAGMSLSAPSDFALPAPPVQPVGLAPHRLATLLVEDNAVIRANLSATLEEMSTVQVVAWVGDEAGALDWLADPAHGVALVIVDIFLAGGSGLGVLRGARALGRALALVVLSNYVTPELRQRCLELGADRVFDKSTEIDALISCCKALAQGAAQSHKRAAACPTGSGRP
jgi:DNA-binding NarL/FixJ family response regulator